jgi:stage II sporulation protein AB (anti-sigma F factor)
LPTSGNALGSYRREYPQTGKAVGQARREVVEFARRCGFSGQSLADIEAAVGEGLANAVEHGQDDGTGFGVWARRYEAMLVIEIKDGGRGFDHDDICSRARRPPVDSLRGFGTFIMRELMDDVFYSEAGTRLHLLKRIPEERPNLRFADRD